MTVSQFDALLLVVPSDHSIPFALHRLRDRHGLARPESRRFALQNLYRFDEPDPRRHSDVVRVGLQRGTLQPERFFPVPRLEMVFDESDAVAVVGGHGGPADDLRSHVEGEGRDAYGRVPAVPDVRVVPVQIDGKGLEYLLDIGVV